MNIDEGIRNISTVLAMSDYRAFKRAAMANDLSLSEAARVALAEWVARQSQTKTG